MSKELELSSCVRCKPQAVSSWKSTFFFVEKVQNYLMLMVHNAIDAYWKYKLYVVWKNLVCTFNCLFIEFVFWIGFDCIVFRLEFWTISKKKCAKSLPWWPDHYPDHYPFKENNAYDCDLAHFFGDGTNVKSLLRLSHLYIGDTILYHGCLHSRELGNCKLLLRCLNFYIKLFRS